MNKKTTSKTKSPAPATKTTKPKSKKSAAETTPAAVAAVALAAAPAPVALATPAPVAASPVSTTIQARIDVGFGNTLYIRGEGAGLSWDSGRLMTCVEDDLWQVKLGESARPIAFKFLINDLTWSAGPNYTTNAGQSVTLSPTF